MPGELFPYGKDIDGLTLGIIGLGSIGKALAVRAQACGMKIVYYNRRRVQEPGRLFHEHLEFTISYCIYIKENGAKYVSMEELLATSDVISVNYPLTPATYHLLGPVEFSKMKTGVYIVNTARGAIIDEEALVQALKSGKGWPSNRTVSRTEIQCSQCLAWALTYSSENR